MSFGQGDPRVYLLNLDNPASARSWATSRHDLRTALLARRRSVIMSLQRGSNSNIFVMNLGSKAITRSPTRRRSTPRRPFRPTPRKSASSRIAAAGRRST